jgi:hypothetical protein
MQFGCVICSQGEPPAAKTCACRPAKNKPAVGLPEIGKNGHASMKGMPLI